MFVEEFQAVVLAAGRGSRMTELTIGRPKCLLPVGQHPILYHTLQLLEKTGFKGAIVVVLNSAQNQIQSVISRCDLKINIEYVAIPSDASEDWGTAESLQYLISQERIKSDIVLLSCDIFTNSNLDNLLTTFRQHDASLAALFFQPLNDPTQNEPPPGAKNKYKPEKDIVGIDKETSRLVFLSSASDFEETVPLKRSILRRYKQISLRTDLIDGHIYVMSLKLAKFLSPDMTFSTLKGEFLPYVVGKQHTRSPLSSEGVAAKIKLGLLHDNLKESKLDENVREVSSYNDHSGDLKQVYQGDSIRCYGVTADIAHFGIRINSVSALWHANRLVTKNGGKIEPTADVKSNQVEESFIGPNCSIHEKTSIRASVLSDHCSVLPRSRIQRSILLRKTEIKEGSFLENCVLGNDVKIGANCELKNCVIGANHEVAAGTKAIFQVLTQSDRLMEI